jgi:hypothetical protein
MGIASLIAVLAGLVFVVVSVSCRQRIAYRARPSWFLAIGGAISAALIMVLIFYGPDIFTQRFWNDDTPPMAVVVPVLFGAFALVSFIPALLVVRNYRRRFRNE